MVTARRFDVGGVWLDRPFKVRRLGHVGHNVRDVEACLRFYRDLLGFAVSDVVDFAYVLRHNPDLLTKFGWVGDVTGYFLRHTTEHHTLVLGPRGMAEAMEPDARTRPDITVNQIAWQVGSLREVMDAVPWLAEQGVRERRTGRDAPGSNWHTYFYDPDGHVNELFYGIEQVGWSGRSKPPGLPNAGIHGVPPLPQPAEIAEVQNGLEQGVDPLGGYGWTDPNPARFDVDGLLLPRPFKVVRVGPVRLFVEDVAAAKTFYEQVLGFVTSEETHWEGHRCVFLRTGADHHALALYPLALRSKLGRGEHTTTLSLGLQVATYQQLRAAMAFLRERGTRLVDLPPELSPGIDYSAFAEDPDGHLVQLYFAMEQVGWDGRARTTSERRHVEPDTPWPETLEPLADTYSGETYIGPWA